MRLNRTGLLEPLTLSDLRTEPAPNEGRVNLTVKVREVRGRWSLSGPFRPATVLGPPSFMLGIRLPAWGKGAAELSTYYAAVSVSPVAGAVLLAPRMRWQPLVSLARLYLPGQGWLSSFAVSPQLSVRQTVRTYGLTHVLGAVEAALGQDDSLGPPGMSIPAWWGSVEPGLRHVDIPAQSLLQCEPPRSSRPWLRDAGTASTALVTNWLLMAALR